MGNLLASWKTTFLGISGIIAVLAKWTQAGAVDWNDMPTIMASIGVILAKDNNVTGVK
jgi:hypothetical protein